MTCLKHINPALNRISLLFGPDSGVRCSSKCRSSASFSPSTLCSLCCVVCVCTFGRARSFCLCTWGHWLLHCSTSRPVFLTLELHPSDWANHDRVPSALFKLLRQGVWTVRPGYFDVTFWLLFVSPVSHANKCMGKKTICCVSDGFCSYCGSKILKIMVLMHKLSNSWCRI